MTFVSDRFVTAPIIVTVDEAWVVERLERAGKTLLALPERGYRPGLAQRRHDVLQSIWDAFSWSCAPILRAPAPSKDDIALLDEVLPDWVLMIPQARVELRRIVQCRLMVHPVSGVHLYPWRRLGEVMHMDHKGVQRRHAAAIKFILEGLPKRPKNH